MRRFKKMRFPVLLILVICLLNQALTFALEPAKNSTSANMWEGYNYQKDLTAVFVGSSLCHASMNPSIIDPLAGIKAYNMGTNGQMLSESYTAIETAIRDHHIKMAVLGFGYFSMQKKQSLGAEVAFYRAKNTYGSAKDRLQNHLTFLLDPEHLYSESSINYFFPWIYDHCGMSGEELKKNIAGRITNEFHKTPEYTANGFLPSSGRMNINRMGTDVTGVGRHEKFDQSSYEELAKICQLCRKNQVKLYVIEVAQPDLYVVAYGKSYFEKQQKLTQVCRDNGGEYYDFNMIKPVLFTAKQSYFRDHEHMNTTGATAFSKAIGTFLQMREKGENVSSLFYTEAEYLKNMNYIACVNFVTRQKNGMTVLHAKAYTGPDVKVEYEFEEWDRDSRKFKEIRPYSADQDCIFAPGRNGRYLLRVNSRLAGSKDPWQKYYEKKINWER